ncbi:MAG TPA: [FeFe] hydrogenase H-cluster radical SAM maturase HydG [Holophaga sp.]|nr:[FeFe] hydrogenase H-cluster radical SAM maturase HydG [Holophaga sp.]
MVAYDPKSMDANAFIHHEEILESLAQAKRDAQDPAKVRAILEKAATYVGLTHREAAALLEVQSPEILGEVFAMARRIKEHIYGRRIVMFAPLYLSDYCVNGCTYCGYSCKNKTMARRKLTQEELAEEVRVLEGLGHKRLALEAGEDPVNCPLEYVLECIQTIYSLKFNNGEIRRANVNIAATTVENYRRLKDAGIGTYILFQETYHKPTYLTVHSGPKRNYEWHTEAHDRAMQGGVDDVGLGVLYGLYEWKYDTVAMLMHGEHLEAAMGVGPHTLSVPRIRSASGVDAKDYPYLVSDDDFKKVVAVLRLAVPYTGMILSTREPMGYREEVIALGISQVSAGSCTGVGGYAHTHKLGAPESVPQFEPADHRSPTEVLKDLLKDGYIPSYCTACYREGRTGDRFMRLAKTGQIANVCQPNALLTLQEYMEDYGDEELRTLGQEIIARELETIPNPKAKEAAAAYLERIRNGERDLRF